jgi:hypothetical protein
VPWGDVALHAVALLAYPGALLTLAFGLVAETANAGAGGRRLLEALQGALARLGGTTARAPAVMLATALLASVAAAQLAVPLSPVTPPERSLLASTVALAAAMWLAWTWAWEVRGARLALALQGCWLLAMLAPALVSQTLRPQALGAVVVTAGLPMKLIAGLLYLICLPGLLRLLPGLVPGQGREREQDAVATRLVLWFPLCGLFTSLFVPPFAEDAGGAAGFLGVTLVVAALTIAQGRLLGRHPEAAGLAARIALPVAALVLVTAAITAIVT